jgi:hypothetical protein
MYFSQFDLSFGRPDLNDLILSPHPQRSFGKYVFFHPKISPQTKTTETSTIVPWEEPLKETANIALNNAKIR